MIHIDCRKLSDPSKCSETLNYGKVSNKHLTIVSLNIRSIHHNLDSFLVFLSCLDVQADVIVLSECFTKTYNPPPIHNFNMFYSKISYNKNDGVVVYVRDHFNVNCYEPISVIEGNCLVAELNNLFSIICTYRPPCFKNPTAYLNSLDNLITSLSIKNNIILTGDININILPGPDFSEFSSNYLDMTAAHDITQAINLPTRHKTCLDHFMVKLNTKWQTIVFEELTDHSPILLSVELTKPRINTLDNKHRTCTKLDAVRESLSQISWKEYYDLPDVDSAAIRLVSTIQDAVDKNSILKLITCKFKPIKPWITSGLIKCIKKRNLMQKKCRQVTDNDEIKLKFKKYRNLCNNLIKVQKQKYYTDQLENARGNTKNTWKVIKDLCNYSTKKVSSNALLNIKSNPKDSLNNVNNYFTSIGKELANETLHKLGKSDLDLATAILSSNDSPANSFSLFLTDVKEINSIISGLKNNCAPGHDKIATSVIKFCSLYLAEPIAHLCNLSFTSGIFPATLKKATVCPIYKTGPTNVPSNYRPISLLSTLSKIVEKVANKRLMTYLEKYGLLANNQYGFRSKKSTDDAVLELTSHVSNSLNRGHKCIGIFLDLQKAFDTVSIPILLARLENVGIRGVAHDWFRNYLTRRQQHVRVENVVSDGSTCSYGVPQGSTLGPSLFLIYINELCRLNSEGAETLMFADDTVLLFSASTWECVYKKAETGLAKTIAWLEDNLLSLNTSKTKYVAFSKTNSSRPLNTLKIQAHSYPCNRTKTHITCDCRSLTCEESIKYLGVIIDNKLKWCAHIDAVSKRTRKLIYTFKSLRLVASKELIIQTYKALAQCTLSYCISSWGGAAKTHMIVAERAQRALLKVAMRLKYRHSTTDLYKLCEVLSVRKLFIRQCILRYHVETVPNLPVRNQRLDYCPVPRCSSSVARRHYNNLAPMLYNSINKENNIKKLVRHKAKSTIHLWLNKFEYEQTEQLVDNLCGGL